jgi:hypothetical protein
MLSVCWRTIPVVSDRPRFEAKMLTYAISVSQQSRAKEQGSRTTAQTRFLKINDILNSRYNYTRLATPNPKQALIINTKYYSYPISILRLLLCPSVKPCPLPSPRSSHNSHQPFVPTPS